MTNISDAASLDSSESINGHIQNLFKEARRRTKLNQSDFGAAIAENNQSKGVSRFTINRVETGNAELSYDIARKLDAAIRAGRLSKHLDNDYACFEALVRRRDQITVRPQATSTPEKTATRLLVNLDLKELHCIMADQLDLARVVDQVYGTSTSNGSPNRHLVLRMVVPSSSRIFELHGRFYPDAAKALELHVYRQVRALRHLAAGRSDLQMTLRESDVVHSSLLLAQYQDKVECAAWPALPTSLSAAESMAPVVVSSDPAAISEWRAYFDNVSAEDRSRKAVYYDVSVYQSNTGGLKFTRCSDMEETPELVDGEGFAVALILPFKTTPRPPEGLANCLILEARSTTRDHRPRDGGGRISLISSGVEHTDILKSLGQQHNLDAHIVRTKQPALEPRRAETSDPEAMTAYLLQRLASYNEEVQREVLDRAFLNAAKRELRDSYDLNLDNDGTEHSPGNPSTLPELQLLKIPNQLALVPVDDESGGIDNDQPREDSADRRILVQLFKIDVGMSAGQTNIAGGRGGEEKRVFEINCLSRHVDDGQLNHFLNHALKDPSFCDILEAILGQTRSTNEPASQEKM